LLLRHSEENFDRPAAVEPGCPLRVKPDEICFRLASDVRFGSKADIEADQSDVRFTPKSGHR
jgi:hypothetical protein